MTLKIGIIGCGGIAATHMKGYAAAKGIEVVACADISLERAKAFATKFDIPRAYDDYKKLLEAEKLNAVSVCTPNYAHSEPTMLALDAGLAVLCEKPMAMNAAEASEMVDKVRAKKGLLTIGHHFRFQPYVKFARQAIERGDLGQIYFGRSHALRRRGIPGWGQFHIKEKSGGGPLVDIGVHTLDLIVWLMGSPEPATVSGTVYTKFGNRKDFFTTWGEYKRDEYDVEDYACGMVKFTNGATLLLEASWAAHLPEMDNYRQMILGDKGGAVISPFLAGEPPLRLMYSSGEAVVNAVPEAYPEVDVYIAEIAHFLACVRGEAEVLIKPEESLNIQRIMDSVYLSSERGREVVVAEEFGAKKKARR
ncbi:MAG: Gfo/Idh/MocA family oxidoreductase [Candidatus Sumerlaeaceae bacterium]|nr:Gfo/Idh/MocA family oxidoreductase [Candidatus Sumerlaeaceae bacterium]